MRKISSFFIVRVTPAEFGHSLSHQSNIKIRNIAILLLIGLRPTIPSTHIHLAILIQDFLQSGLIIPNGLIISLQLNLKTQISHWQFLHELPLHAMLVHFELHLIDLLNVVNGHGLFLLRLRSGTIGRISLFGFAGEEVVIDGGLVLAELVFHIEEGVVICVFGVAAVFVLEAGALVDVVENVIGRNGLALVLVETFIEELLAGH
jgi:hypothetical protein